MAAGMDTDLLVRRPKPAFSPHDYRFTFWYIALIVTLILAILITEYVI